MNANDNSHSLLSALTAVRIPSENHEFIRRLTDRVGVSSPTPVDSAKPHVRVNRRDGKRALQIHWGFTTGFISEEDARYASGGAGDIAPSGTIRGTWFVTHPLNKVYVGSERTRKVRREGGFCGRCGEQLPLTGTCGNCD